MSSLGPSLCWAPDRESGVFAPKACPLRGKKHFARKGIFVGRRKDICLVIFVGFVRLCGTTSRLAALRSAGAWLVLSF
jgi:hypothetical protein